MPQIDWTPEFKRTTSVEFDRLKLKVGERARVVILEKPTRAFVHTLRAPKIVDGRASKIIKKRKDGSEFADWDMDFVGRPQCSGDLSTIDEDGSDPKNCPVCARAKDSEEVAAPERRYAVNVIKYNTKADGTPVSPFGCSSQVWTFTENTFSKLVDISTEHGGLVGRDLVLGPCQPPEAFQKFDIAAGAKNIWETDDTVRKIVAETHQNNRVEELDLACGRKTEVRWLKEDLNKIADKWRIAHGKQPGGSATEQQEVASLKGELDNLIAPEPAASHVNPALAQSVDHGTATDADKRESAGGSDPDDFSKLLQGLKI